MMADAMSWSNIEREVREMARDAQTLLYVPNTGNAGDALIASGAWQFFDDLGLQPRVSRTRRIAAGDTVIYAGGGNLVPEYTDCAAFLERCLSASVKRALVLPHTIRGHAGLLGRLDARFTLVCREARSMDWALRHAPGARVLFAPDMALRLDVPRLFRQCADPSTSARHLLQSVLTAHVLRYLQWRWSIARVRPVDGLLTVYRDDVEAVAESAGWRQADLSAHFGSSYRMRLESDFVSRDFLAVLMRADTVRTNRLHVGIGAALLGKRVVLSDNSYGKIRAVFDASLANLPNVSFADGVLAGLASQRDESPPTGCANAWSV